MSELSAGWKAAITAAVVAVGVPLAILASVPIIIIDGYVASWLWQWFVSEPFGVMPLSIAHFAGLALTWKLFAGLKWNTRKEREKEKGAVWWAAIIGRIIVSPAMILLMGYIAHRWMP